MIDLGDPLLASDTCLIRAEPASTFAALGDPNGYAAFWPGVRTLGHDVSGNDAASADGPILSVGDRYRLRGLAGRGGVDVEVVVTDLRIGRNIQNLWMDWKGDLDPIVGLPLQRRAFEAEAEWYVRQWRASSLVTFIWRIRSRPRFRQERLILDLRRMGWRAMTGLKRELESLP